MSEMPRDETLMEDLSTFKNEIRAEVAQIGAGLESRIKSLELMRVQPNLQEIRRLGSRVKILGGRNLQ